MYKIMKPLTTRGKARDPRVVAIETMKTIKNWANGIGGSWQASTDVIRYATRAGRATGEALPGSTRQDWENMRDYAIAIGGLAAELEKYADSQIKALSTTTGEETS